MAYGYCIDCCAVLALTLPYCRHSSCIFCLSVLRLHLSALNLGHYDMSDTKQRLKALQFKVSITNNLFMFGGSETDTVQRDVCVRRKWERYCAARYLPHRFGWMSVRHTVDRNCVQCEQVHIVNKCTAQSHLNFSYLYPSVPVCLSHVFLICETTNVITKYDCPYIFHILSTYCNTPT
jgi:hypothetical protein